MKLLNLNRFSPVLPSTVAIAISFATLSTAAQAVTYRVTFDGLWVASQVDPGTYPGSAHFSPMVGSTHKPGLGFWVPGGTASAGLEDVAELGNDTTLEAEVNFQILQDDANAYFEVAGDLFNLPNSGSTTITTDSTFHEITLASMIAPSPDWFVGVYNEPLMENGEWKADFSVDLQVWDAGTEVNQEPGVGADQAPRQAGLRCSAARPRPAPGRRSRRTLRGCAGSC